MRGYHPIISFNKSIKKTVIIKDHGNEKTPAGEISILYNTKNPRMEW